MYRKTYKKKKRGSGRTISTKRRHQSHKKSSVLKSKKSINVKSYSRTYKIDKIMKDGDKLVDKFKELCDSKNETEYDKMTQEIIEKYIKENNKDFFIYLDHKIKKFDVETLQCLERSLTRLQEDAIPESMPHLHYILTHRNS
jgi:dihydroxyacetone kinase-like predicted kinase